MSDHLLNMTYANATLRVVLRIQIVLTATSMQQQPCEKYIFATVVVCGRKWTRGGNWLENTGTSTLGIVTLPEKRTVVQVLPVSRRKLNDWIYTSTYTRVQVTVKPISF